MQSALPALYSHLWRFWFCHIFPDYLINGLVFGSEQNTCIFTQFCRWPGSIGTRPWYGIYSKKAKGRIFRMGTHYKFRKKLYTGCPRRNVKYFGRVFLMLNYTDITQNTCIQSWMVTEIMTIEKCGLLGSRRTVAVRDATLVHCPCR